MPEPLPKEITLTDMIDELDRELGLRRWVYPNQIAKGKLKPDKADRQIAILEAIKLRLKSGQS